MDNKASQMPSRIEEMIPPRSNISRSSRGHSQKPCRCTHWSGWMKWLREYFYQTFWVYLSGWWFPVLLYSISPMIVHLDFPWNQEGYLFGVLMSKFWCKNSPKLMGPVPFPIYPRLLEIPLGPGNLPEIQNQGVQWEVDLESRVVDFWGYSRMVL